MMLACICLILFSYHVWKLLVPLKVQGGLMN